MFERGIRRENLLEDDLVFPTVTKVIFVNKTSLHLGSQICNRVTLLVERLWANAPHVWIGRAIESAAHKKVVEVTVGPTHYTLNDAVQSIEFHVRSHHDAAPDRQLEVLESDLKLIEWHAVGLRSLVR